MPQFSNPTTPIVLVDAPRWRSEMFDAARSFFGSTLRRGTHQGRRALSFVMGLGLMYAGRSFGGPSCPMVT